MVVGTTTTNKDLDAVADQETLVLLQSAGDSLEYCGDVGEVGDTITDDEDLAIRTRLAASHQVNYDVFTSRQDANSLMVLAYSYV